MVICEIHLMLAGSRKEAYAVAAAVSYVLSLVEDGMLKIAFELIRHQERLAQLAQGCQDRQPDLADLCLICMSEMFPQAMVITVDEGDFRVYRRNNRDAIPILCPPTLPGHRH